MLRLSCVDIDDDEDLFFFRFPKCLISFYFIEAAKVELTNFIKTITIVGDGDVYKNTVVRADGGENADCNFQFDRETDSSGKLIINYNSSCIMLDVTYDDIVALYKHLVQMSESLKTDKLNSAT